MWSRGGKGQLSQLKKSKTKMQINFFHPQTLMRMVRCVQGLLPACPWEHRPDKLTPLLQDLGRLFTAS